MRFFYIYIVFFVFGIVRAQETKYVFNVKWSEPFIASENFPSRLVIEDQQGYDEVTGLPVKLHEFPISDGITLNDLKIDVKVVSTEMLSGQEEKIVNEIKGSIDMLKSYFIAYKNKRPFLNVEIIPLIFSESSGTCKKVTGYELDITVSADKGSKKSYVLKSGLEYAANSVLSGGKWVKIKIVDDGVYRIPYSDLRSWGFSDPSNVKVFGNGGIMLPKANDAPRFDDLRENAVWHYGEAIYFYGKGPVKWSYDETKQMWVHQLNDYSSEAYYFLTEDAGRGIEVGLKDNSDETPNIDVDSYDAYDFHEKELRNLLKSGRTWYGEWFSYYGQGSEVFSFLFKNILPDKPVKMYTSVIGRANKNSTFTLSVNGGTVPVQTIPIRAISYSDYTGYFARAGKSIVSFTSMTDQVNVEVKYNMPVNTAQGWLDFLCLNARCELKMEGALLGFRDASSAGEGNIARFLLGNADDKTVVWDVTDFTRPLKVKGTLSGNTFSFITKADSIKQYVAFTPGNEIPVPEFIENVENQDLHSLSGIDYVIVAYKDYVDAAERLADLHRVRSGLTTLVVTSEKIYNEFSSGQPDVSAIRDFMRMLYKKAATTEEQPKYLLLFGDGSYDNRLYDDKNTNRILTYQSVNSIHVATSYVSDDFYGFLDDDEGEDLRRGKLDIGLGRFPVNTVQAADDAVDKVETYMDKQTQGKWKALVTFVGDDGDNNIHMRDADRLAQKISVTHPEFDQNKIYLDSYRKVTTSTGKAYPEVNELIEKTINVTGTLLFNYTGHGGENGLAHERIITIPEIQSWTNIDRLPLFVTATCEFSRFDDPFHTSAGEWVFLNSLGGGIALFTTTRMVYSSLNFIINNNLFNYVFERDDQGNKLRFGDIMRLTKNASGTSINKLNFTLLGDPALSVAYPSHYVETVQVNGKPVAEVMDTLKALSKATVEGEVVNGSLLPMPDYQGVLDITVYDKPVLVYTLGNDGGKPFEYEVYQNKLFTGQVSVEEGNFISEFIVSKDIRYNIGNARISYYSSDNENVEAFGANNDIIVGGMTESPPYDKDGPEINMYLNKVTFNSGDNTGTRPLLFADIFDENGINTSGIGIGHDLTLVIDDNKSQTLVMNSYFESKLNSYKKGTVVYQLPEQEPGLHKLTFKAWDNLNNSSTAEVLFNVTDDDNLEVSDVTVYPNPVSYNGSALLFFTHDEPNVPLTLEISTFDVSGQLLNKVQEKTVSHGVNAQPVTWFPQTFNGALLGPGLYIIRFKVTAQTGQTSVFSQKILVTE